MEQRLSVSKTDSGVTIKAEAIFDGGDLIVKVSGGDRPHIGSVSLAIPRESLAGDGSRSATVSTINLTGHKDNEIGDLFAYELAKHTGHICVVTCGVHIDSLKNTDIVRVISVANNLLEDLIKTVKVK